MSFCNDLKTRKKSRKEFAVKRGEQGAEDLCHSRIGSFEHVIVCDFLDSVSI